MRGGGRRGSSRLGVASRRSPDGLTRGQAGPDHARRAERFVRRAHAAAGDEEVLDVAGLQAAKRNVVVGPVVEILVGGPESSFFPQLDRPAGAGDAVGELPAAQDVLARQLIAPDPAAALSDAALWRGGGGEDPRKRGHG